MKGAREGDACTVIDAGCEKEMMGHQYLEKQKESRTYDDEKVLSNVKKIISRLLSNIHSCQIFL